MESKMFIFSLFMFSCMIQSSFALKCFTCSSISNPKCTDLSDKIFHPEECTTGNTVQQVGNWAGQLTGSNFEVPVPVCFKVVSRNTTYNINVVSRYCGVKYQNQDPCKTGRNAIQQTGANVPSGSCDVCNDKDGCNSGNSMKLFFTLLVFATMVSTARLFV